jgi:hypothetical protein
MMLAKGIGSAPHACLHRYARLPQGRRALISHSNMLLLPQASSARSRNALLGPLIQHVQTSAPVEFQLPEDIRGFFKDGAPVSHSP